MQKLFTAIAGVAVGLVLAFAPAVARAAPSHFAPKKANVTILHVQRGCHVWFYNGYRAAKLTVTLHSGGTLTITNNDMMPHKLIQTAGRSVRFIGRPAMNHMTAAVKVAFRHTGVYKFRTKAGEDYPGMDAKTIGADNQLRLVVRVVS